MYSCNIFCRVLKSKSAILKLSFKKLPNFKKRGQAVLALFRKIILTQYVKMQCTNENNKIKCIPRHGCMNHIGIGYKALKMRYSIPIVIMNILRLRSSDLFLNYSLLSIIVNTRFSLVMSFSKIINIMLIFYFNLEAVQF